MMQLIVAVFMIRVVIALISDKTKERKEKAQLNGKPVDAKHPDGFQVR